MTHGAGAEDRAERGRKAMLSPELRARDCPELGATWPRGEFRSILEIACAPDAVARRAWRDWSSALGDEPPDLWCLRLLPLVARRLEHLGVAARERARLTGVYRHTWCHNQLRVRGALAAIDSLARASVPALALKGLALLTTAYDGDFGLRGMLDVDVLVRKEDLPRAAQTLKQQGFRSVHPPTLDELCCGVTSFGENGCALHRGELELDLHWHFSRIDPSTWLDDLVWSHAQRVKAGRVELTVPSATELLLLVALHGAMWTPAGPVLWPADAWRLVGSGAVDWERLVSTTRMRLLTLPVFDALRFAASALHAPVPADVLNELGASPVSAAERSEYRALTLPRHTASFPDRVRAARLSHLRSQCRGALGEDSSSRGPP
jgi:hypothetical protein